MRTFVLRARSAPTDSRGLLDAVGREAHTEILAHALMNAFCVAQSHRPDVVLYLVLERSPDYSRTIRLCSNEVRDLGGFHEQIWLGKLARALDASSGMGKDETRGVEPGIEVRTTSFEKLVQELAGSHRLFVLDRKGTPAREVEFPDRPCFVLTDHVPMPKKSFHTLQRLGAKRIALGPRMLFASQCMVVLHNELDLAQQR